MKNISESHVNMSRSEALQTKKKKQSMEGIDGDDSPPIHQGEFG